MSNGDKKKWGSKRKSMLRTKPSRSTSGKGTKNVFAVVGPGMEKVEYLDYKPRTSKDDAKKTQDFQKKMSVRSVPVVTSTSRPTRGSTTNGKLLDWDRKAFIESFKRPIPTSKKTAKRRLSTGSKNFLNKPRFSLRDILLAVILYLIIKLLISHLTINFH